MAFDDAEREKVYVDFMTRSPLIHQYYMDLAIHYNHYGEAGETKYQAEIGREIFNLIIPHAQSFDPRLLHWIPKDTIDLFHITYQSDNFHIKSWSRIDTNSYGDASDSGDDPQTPSRSHERGDSNSTSNS